MEIKLPELPYKSSALEPYISARTLEFHHGKHHNAYVSNLNKLIDGTELADSYLDAIISKTANDPGKTGIFNNAAQAWNHGFYWQCMKPGGGKKPGGEVADRIDASFGSFDKFLDEMKNAGITQFGSGWAWLALEGDRLKVVKTSNADLPIIHSQQPLLTIDVWEHAYYIDYQNRRPDYISVFLNHLVNWDFVAYNLEKGAK